MRGLSTLIKSAPHPSPLPARRGEGKIIALLVSFTISFHALAGGSVTAKRAALSTAHPLATKVGLSVLQKGGTAADAAVAVAFALAVVHPQAGNLGGGGFLIYYDAATRGVWTLDFRETAPREAKKDMRSGVLAAGVPGTVAGLDALHTKFGTKSWKELLDPAIAIAKDGVKIEGDLASDIDAAKRDRHLEIPKTLPPPELVATLQRLGEHGARDFYDGELAKKIVEGLREAGGIIGYRDLREYQPVWRAPIKLRYGAYEIHTVPPPSGGGLVIGETLNILSADNLAASGFQTPKSLHLILEASRRAWIDRAHYVGDPLNARIPYRELLSQKRAETWREGIQMDRVIATSMLTEPRDLVVEASRTTHFTIADAAGNIVALTTTLGDDFGSGVLVPGAGFFLNNALADFANSGANGLEPAKRPASSLAPTIVLRDGKPFLALGSRGGATIPSTVLQVFLNVVVYGKSLAAAVAAPRWHHQATPDEVVFETSRAPKETIHALNAKGHAVSRREAIGDVHAILFENGRLTAVADPRRGGAAGGF